MAKTSEQIIVTNASEAITEIARVHREAVTTTFYANCWLFTLPGNIGEHDRVAAVAYPAGPGRWRLEIEEGVTL